MLAIHLRKSLLVVALLMTSLPALNAEENGRIGVMVSIAPLANFVERIGSTKVNITIMVPAVANEHAYEPTPNQLKELSRARLYVAVGSGIEFELAWLERFRQLNPSIEICDASKGVPLLEGSHGHGHGHHDPHIWLSPENVKIMAKQIANALSEIDPDNQAYYEKNFENFLAQLDGLRDEIKNILSGTKKRDFIISHSAWRYFAAVFNLNEIAIESEGKEPSASRIVEIVREAREKQVKSVFVVPQFSRRNAEMIAREIGGKLIIADPLNQDYFQSLREFAKNLQELS